MFDEAKRCGPDVIGLPRLAAVQLLGRPDPPRPYCVGRNLPHGRPVHVRGPVVENGAQPPKLVDSLVEHGVDPEAFSESCRVNRPLGLNDDHQALTRVPGHYVEIAYRATLGVLDPDAFGSQTTRDLAQPLSPSRGTLAKNVAELAGPAGVAVAARKSVRSKAMGETISLGIRMNSPFGTSGADTGLLPRENLHISTKARSRFGGRMAQSMASGAPKWNAPSLLR